jgi:DNA-directed RNA polymerase specialized sigma24 family protein
MEGNMKTIQKTQLDILDDIYSLAYWMTGNQGASQDLVKKTYLYGAPSLEENVLLKTFRDCYVEEFGQKVDFWFNEKGGNKNIQITDSLKQWAADIKFSVLLSEISGLPQQQISEILDKPLETIRLWLFWGRKLYVNNYLLKASA